MFIRLWFPFNERSDSASSVTAGSSRARELKDRKIPSLSPQLRDGSLPLTADFFVAGKFKQRHGNHLPVHAAESLYLFVRLLAGDLAEIPRLSLMDGCRERETTTKE